MLQQEQHSLISVAKQQHIYKQCCLVWLSRNVAIGNGKDAIGASNIMLVHNN